MLTIQVQYRLVSLIDHYVSVFWLVQPDHVQWPTEPLIIDQASPDQTLPGLVQTQFNHRSHLSVALPQVQLQAPSVNLSIKTLTIPAVIYLTPNQGHQLINHFADQPTDSWSNGEWIDYTNQPPQTLTPMKTSRQTTIQWLHADLLTQGLTHLHWLLAEPFTTNQLSSLLTQVSSRPIKRNNLKRAYHPHLIVVGKDRTHVGYPKDLLRFQP